MPTPPETPPVPRASADDMQLVMRLREGDESAFMELVDRYHASLVRLARRFVSSQAVAEDVAQEAWVGVLRGIGSFEGRSSLRTWIYRILANTAKTRARREARSVPFAALSGPGEEAAVDPDRFLPAGNWASAPDQWSDLPEQRLLGDELRRVVDEAIEQLPANQATVIRLRDVEGFESSEVRDLLDLSEVNQRVLLHRARSRVRAALERYLEGDR